VSWEEDAQIEHMKEGTEGRTSLRASGLTGKRRRRRRTIKNEHHVV